MKNLYITILLALLMDTIHARDISPHVSAKQKSSYSITLLTPSRKQTIQLNLSNDELYLLLEAAKIASKNPELVEKKPEKEEDIQQPFIRITADDGLEIYASRIYSQFRILTTLIQALRTGQESFKEQKIKILKRKRLD
jgi:hypothetical protein